MPIPTRPALPSVLVPFVALLAMAAPAVAQVHHFPDGRPWSNRARQGPDAEVEGWFYNLGTTGLRVALSDDAPCHLLVRHVFEDTPAAGKVRVGDAIVGAGGAAFETPHRNGYGMDVFGPTGPVLDLARALEAAQGKEGRGRLELDLLRDGETLRVALKLPTRPGAYGETFPACNKSAAQREALLAYLLEQQRPDGSWGSPPQDTFAPLALLSSGKREHLEAARRNARFHAANTSASEPRREGLLNWKYMAAGIVLSEYYLATRERWVLEELEQVRDFLMSSQYTDLSQVNPRVRETHPGSYPRDAREAHGGWGHNPGFEGYGPICMLTGQGALALALMVHCGVEVDRERHEAAYAFLARGTGRNGYVWYEDEAASADGWADMGRTGAAGIANGLSPYDDPVYRTRALAHARVIGEHPDSFPDTHGSPILGMGYAAMAAALDPGSFERLMAANRWWFVLSECPDGTFHYQPNRDNAGYGADSRLAASAVVAFVLSIPEHNLAVTGRELRR